MWVLNMTEALQTPCDIDRAIAAWKGNSDCWPRHALIRGESEGRHAITQSNWMHFSMLPYCCLRQPALMCAILER